MRLSIAFCAAAVLPAACGAEAEAPRSAQCREEARDVPRFRTFAPPVYSEGGRTVMPIVFSDGTSAELTFPRELGLDSLGVSALRTSGVVEAGGPASGRAVDVRYGAPPDEATPGDGPIACYDGAHGQVEVWETGDRVTPHRMLVPLHSWTAYISDGNAGNFLEEDQRRAWATALAADPHANGWVILRPSKELRIGAEHTGDVSLELGDLDRRAILLWPIQCKEEPGRDDVEAQLREDTEGQAVASWCDERGPMAVHVYADAPFIRDVAKHLEIRDVRHAHDPGEYHVVP